MLSRCSGHYKCFVSKQPFSQKLPWFRRSRVDSTRSLCIGFDPNSRELSKADRFFQNVGPKATLQGSFLKLKDTENLQALSEIAFVGRTSVGKSSLLNAVLYQKKLAKTSKRPGHTRLINFFNVASKLYLVDLPGYGFVEGLGSSSTYFVNVVERYLQQRSGKQLRSVCLLIDGKVGVTKNDLKAIEMLEEFNTPFQVVITKMDKVNKQLHPLVISQVSQEMDKHSTM